MNGRTKTLDVVCRSAVKIQCRRAHLNRFAVLAIVAGMAACSGGGSGGGGGNGGNDDDADPTGIWIGTDARDGGSSAGVTAVVSQNGRFTTVSANLYLVGNGSTDGTAFTASATGWAAPGETFSNGATSGSFSLTGTAFDRSSISGSYTGSGESGTLTLSYDVAQSDKSTSLSLISGSYTTGGGNALSISNSTMTFNSSAGPNCIGNGTISHEDTTRNVFAWSMTLSGCDATNGTATGVAFLRDFPPGLNNRLTLTGSVGNTPFIVIATK